MNTRLLALALLPLLPLSLSGQSTVRYDVALLGDMPYGAAREAPYQRLIDDVNSFRPQLVAHIGDTKSGSTVCDDAHYTKTLGFFNNFYSPVIYSVGDNEWTDCLRANNGRFDPVGRLKLVRSTYFFNNFSLGRLSVELTRQSDAYPENAMWIRDPAVFLSVHMTGSNNNLEYKSAQGAANPFYDNDEEFKARNAANLAWLHAGFKAARDNHALGLVILTQANVFESFMTTGTGSTHSGFADFVKALRDETRKFDGEVYMVSGDSHYMRIDKPLTATYPGCESDTGDCKAIATPSESPGDRVLNFTRVEVPGDGDVHWVLCHVQAIKGRVLACEFRIVDSNR
jgi:hypothetical protein